MDENMYRRNLITKCRFYPSAILQGRYHDQPCECNSECMNVSLALLLLVIEKRRIRIGSDREITVKVVGEKRMLPENKKCTILHSGTVRTNKYVHSVV